MQLLQRHITSTLSALFDKTYWMLTLLNVVASVFVLKPYHEWWLIGAWIACAFAMALIQRLFLAPWPKSIAKMLLWFIEAIYCVLIITEVFCFMKFGTCINDIILQILFATNTRETTEFIHTYFTWFNVTGLLLLVAAVIFGLNFISGKIAKFRQVASTIAITISSIGIGYWLVMIAAFATIHNGLNIPQMNILTRVGHSFMAYFQTRSDIDRLAANAPDFEASMGERAPDMVVIIGESLSRYHSSLYGYSKATNPRLDSLQRVGELIVFTGLSGQYGDTHSAMPQIFSLKENPKTLADAPLFPIAFKNAGYKTVFLSNQYLCNNDISFLSDDSLSQAMFDSRNSRLHRYDYGLLDELSVDSVPTLYIIHLIGQHYTYTERFPHEFSHFKASDYHDIPQKRATTIAAYDNSIRYNDYVIASIIDRFRHRPCCLIYFSDHGEYVCEHNDFYGHGYQPTPENADYLYNLPLLVWTSTSFRNLYPELQAQIERTASTNIDQHQLPQMIIDIADIHTPWFNQAMSPLR